MVVVQLFPEFSFLSRQSSANIQVSECCTMTHIAPVVLKIFQTIFLTNFPSPRDINDTLCRTMTHSASLAILEGLTDCEKLVWNIFLAAVYSERL